MDDYRIAGGVVAASLVAGPAFMFGMAVAVAMDGDLHAGALWPSLLPVTALAVPFGFVLSALPNLIGAALLARTGAGNAGVRLPALWAIVGGVTAGGATAILGGDTQGIVAFAVTGTLCALACRWRTRWSPRVSPGGRSRYSPTP